MIYYDTAEDTKFLDEYWKNNAGKYSKYLEKKTVDSPKKDQSKKQS